jgi:hypothetical protein
VFGDPVRHRPQQAESGQSRNKRNMAKHQEGQQQDHNAQPPVDPEQGSRDVDGAISGCRHELQRLQPTHPFSGGQSQHTAADDGDEHAAHYTSTEGEQHPADNNGEFDQARNECASRNGLGGCSQAGERILGEARRPNKQDYEGQSRGPGTLRVTK